MVLHKILVQTHQSHVHSALQDIFRIWVEVNAKSVKRVATQISLERVQKMVNQVVWPVLLACMHQRRCPQNAKLAQMSMFQIPPIKCVDTLFTKLSRIAILDSTLTTQTLIR